MFVLLFTTCLKKLRGRTILSVTFGGEVLLEVAEGLLQYAEGLLGGENGLLQYAEGLLEGENGLLERAEGFLEHAEGLLVQSLRMKLNPMGYLNDPLKCFGVYCFK